MSRAESSPPRPSNDARFPDGPWTGFFLQPILPGRHGMELILRFADETIVGEGRDRVGEFLIRGRYQTADGRCWWTKTYVGQHDVFYEGFNEGRGIWGTWQMEASWRGGFHIWPEGMEDPTRPRRSASEDAPARVEEMSEVEADAALVTVGES